MPKKMSEDNSRLTDLTFPFERPAARFAWRGFQPPLIDHGVSRSISWKAWSRRQIYFPSAGSLPRLKQYLDEAAGIELGTTRDDIPAAFRGREHTGYASQKPLALMERIVQLASHEGDLVRFVLRVGYNPDRGSVSQGPLVGSGQSTEAHDTTVERLHATYGFEAEKITPFIVKPTLCSAPSWTRLIRMLSRA